MCHPIAFSNINNYSLNGQNIIYTYWSILSSTVTITATLPLAWLRLFSLQSVHARTQHIISYSNTPWDIFFSFCIFSKCTLPTALQTMCRSTFGILQFKTMRAVPERNIEESREIINIQEAIITSGLCSQQEGCWVCLCISVFVCMCLSDCMFSVCVLIVFMHVCEYIDPFASMLCVYVSL